jgi:hypothetical protein
LGLAAYPAKLLQGGRPANRWARAAQPRIQNQTMTCMVETGQMCTYIYKNQSDSIYVCRGVYTADLPM